MYTKSGHPLINSRYLLFEAQQAFHFSLPPHLALGSVTYVPAAAAGLLHRIGTLREGVDADGVLWDSCPLRLGATPVKVWIDGALQIPEPPKNGMKDGQIVVGKGKEGPEWRQIPEVPDWDEERRRAVEWEGLPPLQSRKEDGMIVFRNVTEVWTRGVNGGIEEVFSAVSLTENERGIVVVEKGKVICVGKAPSCSSLPDRHKSVNLLGGSIAPGLMSFGSPLGLEEIAGEPSTGAGQLYDAFSRDIPDIFGDVGGVVRTADALQFGTRNAL
jgi:imidazolonepropionase-like amidohydrolase